MKVEFFGQLAEMAGTSSVDVVAVSSVSDLKKWLEAKFPSVASVHYMVAVNKKMVDGDLNLSGEEHIALMPPFSGG